jgi:pseudouridine-5'-phosphate glycosidase
MDAEAIDAAIDAAIDEAKNLGVRGKDTTPFLLAKIKDLTDGNSLDSNIQLVYNNARLAAKTAAALAAITRGE